MPGPGTQQEVGRRHWVQAMATPQPLPEDSGSLQPAGQWRSCLRSGRMGGGQVLGSGEHSGVWAPLQTLSSWQVAGGAGPDDPSLGQESWRVPWPGL